MRLPKENNSNTIQGYCVSEDEMNKEIELAFLENRLNKLSNDELLELVVKKLRKGEEDDEEVYEFVDKLAKEFWYYLE